MERLTYHNPDGDWGLNGYDIKKVPGELQGFLWKLKDYEDSGLDPDKAAELDEMYLAKCREINELQRKVDELQMVAGKQIPQKVVEDDCCPVCGTCGVDDAGIRGNYCMECGQKLDWGEEI